MRLIEKRQQITYRLEFAQDKLLKLMKTLYYATVKGLPIIPQFELTRGEILELMGSLYNTTTIRQGAKKLYEAIYKATNGEVGGKRE